MRTRQAIVWVDRREATIFHLQPQGFETTRIKAAEPTASGKHRAVAELPARDDFFQDLAGALAVAALVPSHWLLDLPFHRPDLPLWPGGPRVGLGLWNSVPATLVLEGLFLFGGLWLYTRRTRPLDRAGSWGLWAMVGLLLLIYVGSMFSPAPTDPSVIAWSSLTLWLFVPWTAWVDSHRALA